MEVGNEREREGIIEKKCWRKMQVEKWGMGEEDREISGGMRFAGVL